MTSLKRLTACIALLICFFYKTQGQDIHFSQFFNTPLIVSPSNTGNMNGDFRVAGNYRSQWKEISKPYLTQDVSFDRKFYYRQQQICGGILVVNDKSGGHLKVTKVLLSAAYHRTLARNNLHGGIQFGYVGKRFSLDDETFPNQMNWDKGYFDSNFPNNEVMDQRLTNIDLNWGIGWSRKIGTKLEPFFSYSMFHAYFPKETFFNDGKNHLKARSLINAGTNVQVAEKVSIMPNLLLAYTTKASEFIIGSTVEYTLSEGENIFKRKALYAGLFQRNSIQIKTDAAYLVVGMKYFNWNGAISYDVNTSSLKTATNHKGALEFSLIYTGISTRLTKTEIPCDRY